jgi:asparagine synthase (glutamine-hydrolysing)
MCGIIGIVGGSPKAREDALAKALPTLALRGPDDRGSIFFPGAAIGHTRLAVIDIATGAQPMRDRERDIAITFNGEIFNYQELRSDLERLGHVFVTASDTEVIVKAYLEYGDRCPEHLDGQFAFAIWDNEHARLFIARDRFGEKPLYYFQQGSAFLVASEIKALRATGMVGDELDPVSIDNYLALYFIPSWRSVYRHIAVLAPAHRAVFEGGKLTVERYWSLTQRPVSMSLDEAAASVHDLLAASVKKRMLADVEVGVFLSGGIDSSIVTALAAPQSVHKLKSFAAGFDQYRSELPYAREVASHLGTEHHEHNVPVQLEDIRATIRYFDEPLGDSSIIPTSLIAKAAREKVTVVLSGDGGDELFMGYNHYRAFWQLPAYKQIVAQILGYTPDALYKRSHLNMFPVHERARLWRDGSVVESDPTAHVDLSEAATPLQRLNLLDMQLKLPGDMLVKVDRASMMRSLEVRSPFLQHELAQFAFNLPDAYKTDHARGKLILQRAFADLLPHSVFVRKKEGFGAPVKRWLKDPAIRACLTDMRKDLHISAFLNGDIVRSYIDGFYDGHEELSYKLWMLFTLELWLRERAG